MFNYNMKFDNFYDAGVLSRSPCYLSSIISPSVASFKSV